MQTVYSKNRKQEKAVNKNSKAQKCSFTNTVAQDDKFVFSLRSAAVEYN